MEQYRRIFSTRNGSRLVKKPHIRDCISKARYQVQNEQRARMDEARRKQKEEEKRIQEVVEQAEREEQLSALPDNVRIEAEMLFANMMSEFQQVGGRMPRMDYAISIATDKVKEQQRLREEELRKIEEKKVAEERRIKEAEEAKIQAQKEAEEKVIQARNNESRSARAARFAAAYEKRMAASKNNGGRSGNRETMKIIKNKLGLRGSNIKIYIYTCIYIYHIYIYDVFLRTRTKSNKREIIMACVWCV